MHFFTLIPKMKSEFTLLYSLYFISGHLLFFGHARASSRGTDISLHF